VSDWCLGVDLPQMCEKAEVNLMYLPPYSPDLSPIEESFNGLKQWMRRNRTLSASFEGMFEGFCDGLTPDEASGRA
jgi:hypothetical protein